MKNLLIVDDEVLLAEGLHDTLAEAFVGRLQVFCCYSAERALEIADNVQIDILLTDINMPDCSGLELHRRLQEKQPECRVIYLTGYSEFEYARTALEQHAFAYVLKGEGDDVVISTIERALSADGTEPAGEQTPSPEADSSPNWLPALNNYICAHLDGDLSLNQLANFCHFHPVYLSRAYKEASGVTLSDYISQARLERAKQLLQSSRFTVQEISHMTGFATDNYFCRWFRKNTGITPHAYRRSGQKYKR